MGLFDWKHLAILLIVVVLVFGTKKLKNLGGDLGDAIKGFRKAMNTDDDKTAESSSAKTAEKTAPPLEQQAQATNAAPLSEEALKKG